MEICHWTIHKDGSQETNKSQAFLEVSSLSLLYVRG